MEKSKEPVKVIEFDKTTAQLHVRVETEGNLVSTADPKVKIGDSKTVLVQTIFKEGIQELVLSLEEQKKKHTDARDRGQTLVDAEVTALDMIEKDLKQIKDVIGDLKFKEKKDAKPTTKPK